MSHHAMRGVERTVRSLAVTILIPWTGASRRGPSLMQNAPAICSRNAQRDARRRSVSGIRWTHLLGGGRTAQDVRPARAHCGTLLPRGGFPCPEAGRTGIPVGQIGTQPLPAPPPSDLYRRRVEANSTKSQSGNVRILRILPPNDHFSAPHPSYPTPYQHEGGTHGRARKKRSPGGWFRTGHLGRSLASLAASQSL
ncbi:MAG: hypothetical protein DVB28_001598 [Verrucomicrobia bacterium]|nr:MAG: hypothetical protein DVB28_001598 [Verrucomicrobiota bacterium]